MQNEKSQATEEQVNTNRPASCGSSPNKKGGVYFHPFGCHMNVHDSRKILNLFSGEGYDPVKTAEEADVILENTCSVREKPERKVVSTGCKVKAAQSVDKRERKG